MGYICNATVNEDTGRFDQTKACAEAITATCTLPRTRKGCQVKLKLCMSYICNTAANKDTVWFDQTKAVHGLYLQLSESVSPDGVGVVDQTKAVHELYLQQVHVPRHPEGC